MPDRMHGYDSGWNILLKLVGTPLLFIATAWGVVRLVLWSMMRGAGYRDGAFDFLGVGPMIGLNLLLPGAGLMAGGFLAQGWLCLALWGLVLVTGVLHSGMLSRNLTVVHLFAGVWASVIASLEVTQQAKRVVEQKRKKLARINLEKQRVPTMEDPDQYMIRLETFQLLLEASADPMGRFDTVQKAAINRIRNLLKIEEHTYSKLLKQIQTHGDAQKTLGEGARAGPEAVFEKVLPTAVDHPAFEGIRNPFLDSAAHLLGIPRAEARGRRAAYENGDVYEDTSASASRDQSSPDGRTPGEDLSGDDPTELDADLDQSESGDWELSHDDPTIL